MNKLICKNIAKSRDILDRTRFAHAIADIVITDVMKEHGSIVNVYRESTLALLN